MFELPHRPKLSIWLVVEYGIQYSRSPRVRINWKVKPSGNAEMKIIDFSLKIGYIDCYHLQYVLRLNFSTTPVLKFYKPHHFTVLDPITGNFKAS